MTQTTCPRCSGRGVRNARPVYAGIPGGCYRCAGTGVIDREAERAAKAAEAAREAKVAEGYDRMIEMAAEVVSHFGPKGPMHGFADGFKEHVAACPQCSEVRAFAIGVGDTTATIITAMEQAAKGERIYHSTMRDAAERVAGKVGA